MTVVAGSIGVLQAVSGRIRLEHYHFIVARCLYVLRFYVEVSQFIVVASCQRPNRHRRTRTFTVAVHQLYCSATALVEGLLLMDFILGLEVIMLLVCEELSRDWVEGVACDQGAIS